jgi:hypothetical protein
MPTYTAPHLPWRAVPGNAVRCDLPLLLYNTFEVRPTGRENCVSPTTAQAYGDFDEIPTVIL